jgi:outer membrane protein TolC
MAAWQFRALTLSLGALAAFGCAAGKPQLVTAPAPRPPETAEASRQIRSQSTAQQSASSIRTDVPVRQVAFEDHPEQSAEEVSNSTPESADNLNSLVAVALSSNPRLAQMQQEAAAAWDRVRYIDELPDPEVGAMGVAPPMEYADGRQVAVVSFRQSIPWLKRLDAREQQACFQAWALDSAWQAERLRTVSDVKVAYYRLYALEQQQRINRDNRQLIELLTKIATDRVAAQSATEGDVLLGTLELSRLEEQRYGLDERRTTLRASINRLLNRPAETPVNVPGELTLPEPAWTLDTLRQIAWTRQPDIAAAQLRSQAASWGIRVAELERRPDVTLNLDWMVMRPMQDPGQPAFGGRDSVFVGAMVNVPLWHEKYNAMRDEAVRESMASQFSVQDVQRQYEAMLAELLEQARAAARTAALYDSTMLTQARQTFEADQRAYVGPGTVEFDRVIEDFRTVLTLEEGYHRAMSEWAIALARIEQAIAQDVSSLAAVPEPAPPAHSDSTDGQPRAGAEASSIRQVRTSPTEPLSAASDLELDTLNADVGRNSARSGQAAVGAAEFLGRDRRGSPRPR